MFASEAKIREFVRHDLDSEFVRSLAQKVAWAYRNLFEDLSAENHLPDDIRLEIFNRRRGDVVSSAMVAAAKVHGVPSEFYRIAANGQRKVLLKAGRLILLQEPIAAIGDPPNVSDYKLALADIHGLIKQLELDLGDRQTQIIDWSGCVLCAVLHGATGIDFRAEHRDLGSLMLGVPDAAYRQWVCRIDLQNIAMFGEMGKEDRDDTPRAARLQADKVVVRTKRRNQEKGAG